jgi:hypothetical protein
VLLVLKLVFLQLYSLAYLLSIGVNSTSSETARISRITGVGRS